MAFNTDIYVPDFLNDRAEYSNKIYTTVKGQVNNQSIRANMGVEDSHLRYWLIKCTNG